MAPLHQIVAHCQKCPDLTITYLMLVNYVINITFFVVLFLMGFFNYYYYNILTDGLKVWYFVYLAVLFSPERPH